MVFSSETFLFLFLPLFLGLYYLTPFRYRSALILAGSWTFYGWWRIDFLGLLILTTLWTYAFGRVIGANLGTRRATWACAIGTAGCLSVLGVFKYLNFFIDSFAAMLGTDAAGLGVHWHLILPIGVSFYVFQSISYLIDVYRRDASPTANFFDFAAFISLFPQLVAGPILRFKDLENQFRDRTHTADKFADGMARFTVGLGKKVLIADSLAPLADLAFTTPDPTAPLAWVGALAYMMQLYFDFSGYSDMAIGLGLMMGFRFMENFDTPYISGSITEFWRRWHISLSVWLRDYLYIPLGGNRVGGGRTYVNLMTVMVLGGLWHGANWTFVLWGAWHGGWLAVERWTGIARAPKTTVRVLRTLLIVLIGWVAFRATGIGTAIEVYAGMLGLNGWALPFEIAVQITRESLAVLMLAILLAASEPFLNDWFDRRYHAVTPTGTLALSGTVLPALATTLIFSLAVMRLAEQSFSPFLYFQF
ncbi:MBOAT family protein [Tabrizicola sp.]|uniref:MBOAT family O-acyltransferase n=1 Tax=Tabrizicola sp. TaxID=2005166 RepID=UPI002735A1B3|nr:MBOAT family protein [Tabrizicola sp.]MDP3193907.1 MBOAT family protein [Tabrizicola sp.]